MNPLAMLMLLVQLGVCQPVEFQKPTGETLMVVVCPLEGGGARPQIPGETPGSSPRQEGERDG